MCQALTEAVKKTKPIMEAAKCQHSPCSNEATKIQAIHKSLIKINTSF